MLYTHEQELVNRRLKVEEVSRPSTLDLIETGYLFFTGRFEKLYSLHNWLQ